MADDKKVSLLLDAITAATEAQAQHEADDRARAVAEAKALEAAQAAAEAEDDDEDDDRPRKRPAWLGKSAAELLAGREGRVNSTTDVHTGGARPTDEDD